MPLITTTITTTNTELEESVTNMNETENLEQKEEIKKKY